MGDRRTSHPRPHEMRASEPRDPGTCGVAQGTGPAEGVPAGPGLGASPGSSRWAQPKLRAPRRGRGGRGGGKARSTRAPPPAPKVEGGAGSRGVRAPRGWKGQQNAGSRALQEATRPRSRLRFSHRGLGGPAVPQPGKGHTVPCTPLRGAGTSQQQEGLAWAPQASPDPHGGSHGGDYYHHLYLKAVSYFQALECPFHQKVRWGNKLLDGGRADTQAYK